MIEALIDDFVATQFQIEMANVSTAIPCVVTNVHGDFGDQRVDVQPAINDLFKDGTSEQQPQILSVPVVLPGSNTSLVSFPINVGDTVLCVFSQRSLDNFKISNGLPTPPNDYRKFSDQDAIAIPGLRTFARSMNKVAIRKFPHDPSSDLVVAHNVGSGTEVMIQMKQNGDMIVNTDFNVIVNSLTAEINAREKVTINSPQMDVNVDTTNWNGNIIHDGDVTHTGNVNHTGDYTQLGNYSIIGQARFNGILFDTHFHSGVTSGPNNSGPVAG